MDRRNVTQNPKPTQLSGSFVGRGPCCKNAFCWSRRQRPLPPKKQRWSWIDELPLILGHWIPPIYYFSCWLKKLKSFDRKLNARAKKKNIASSSFNSQYDWIRCVLKHLHQHQLPTWGAWKTRTFWRTKRERKKEKGNQRKRTRRVRQTGKVAREYGIRYVDSDETVFAFSDFQPKMEPLREISLSSL